MYQENKNMLVIIKSITLFVLFTLLIGCAIENKKDDSKTISTTTTINVNTATTPGVLKLLPIGTIGADQTRGYAEYVPPDYKSQTNWPCIIFLHGDGELADGKTVAVLQSFTYSCLPGMIYNNTWDDKHRFVVLAPQFASYADRSAINVNNFIQYVKKYYNIDTKRIYLSAVSGGGVALGNYLDTYSGGEAAAVLPVSCYVPSNAKKWASVPVWFFCGEADTTVNPNPNIINNYKALMTGSPSVLPKVTLYIGVGHDGNSVNKTYAPKLNDNTFAATLTDGTTSITLVSYSNIYDWLLQYHR